MSRRNPFLTPAMRDVLIEHVDGWATVKVRTNAYRNTVQCLIERGLLWTPAGVARPKLTRLTDQGREVLAETLAAYADALVAAGALKAGTAQIDLAMAQYKTSGRRRNNVTFLPQRHDP